MSEPATAGMRLLARARRAGGRELWGFLTVAMLLVAALLVCSPLRPGASGLLRADDLGQLLFAVNASACSLTAAVRRRGRVRAAWATLSAATAAWAAGECLWSWYEVVRHVDTPFPSPADAGFLTFPVLALIGLLVMPHGGSRSFGVRRLLDGLLTTSAIAVISWTTVLGTVARDDGQGRLAFLVSVSYPAGDVLVLAMAIMLLTRAAVVRRPLLLVSIGLGSMALADSGFTYLAAKGSYHTGDVIDLGWFCGFALIALGALAVPAAGVDEDDVSVRPVASYLPFFPPVAAAAVVQVKAVFGGGYDRIGLSLVTLCTLMVVLRQSLTVRENRELIARVADSQAQLEKQAFEDTLTGLANRALFADRLEHALDLHRRDLRELAILFCDLDDFKLVNDSLGHVVGDELLVHVAERLRGTLRPGDTLARLGGDEFAVLLEDGGDPIAVAERLRESLHPAFSVGGCHVLVRASIGLAIVERGDATPTSAEIMSQADIAMYRAKGAGRNEVCLYRPGMNHVDAPDVALSQALAEAISSGAITAHYQPIMNLQTGAVHGVEALARWRHQGRDVPPAVFIPLAERQGLITGLTDLMLETACAQLSRWNADGSLPDLRMGVNVPPILLTDRGFPVRVAAAVGRHGLRPLQLVLEITEGGLIRDPETARSICEQLNAAGARLSLDDFGTGYSSLAHLQTIPLQSLKIDKSFVLALGTEPAGDHQVLEAIVLLAHQLNLSVIAEGIENSHQLDVLTRLDCELGQGFLLARPQPPELLDGFLRGRSREAVQQAG